MYLFSSFAFHLLNISSSSFVNLSNSTKTFRIFKGGKSERMSYRVTGWVRSSSQYPICRVTKALYCTYLVVSQNNRNFFFIFYDETWIFIFTSSVTSCITLLTLICPTSASTGFTSDNQWWLSMCLEMRWAATMTSTMLPTIFTILKSEFLIIFIIPLHNKNSLRNLSLLNQSILIIQGIITLIALTNNQQSSKDTFHQIVLLEGLLRDLHQCGLFPLAVLQTLHL